MKKINIQRAIYHIRHDYLTINNVVVSVALLIGASWAWASIGVMQKNYALQKQVDAKNRQLTLAELETQNLQYQQRYFKTTEYQELAVRERLGKANPGEKVIILPRKTTSSMSKNTSVVGGAPKTQPVSNFQQWMNFLLGGNKNQQ